VTRTVTAHSEWFLPYVTEHLTYTMLATLETYVVVLVVQAWLGSEDSFVLYVNEQGMRIERFVLFGSSPPSYVVMTYNDFIDWATSREEELLEYILDQF